MAGLVIREYRLTFIDGRSMVMIPSQTTFIGVRGDEYGIAAVGLVPMENVSVVVEEEFRGVRAGEPMTDNDAWHYLGYATAPGSDLGFGNQVTYVFRRLAGPPLINREVLHATSTQ